MGLSPIGDIASGGLTANVTQTITWETATDWDNRTSELGVAHESVANTDHNDDTIVRKGYNYTTPFKSSDLEFYLPLHEDSGTTAYDITGNHNGTYEGPTLGQGGILGDTAPEWGTNDVISMGTGVMPTSGDLTFDLWFRPDADGSEQRLCSFQGDREYIISIGRSGSTEIAVWDGSFLNTGATIDDLTWQHLSFVYDDSNTEITGYLNGSQVFSVGFNSGAGSGSDVAIGRDDASGNGNAIAGGRMADVGVWSTAFTASEVQERHDAAGGNSTLTTATKSFSSNFEPNLQNLDYTLNGETITLDVIGSPGTASEEVVSQTLDGSTSYSLTWSSSHTDFRVKIIESVSAVTSTTPNVNRVELVS